MKTKQQYFEEGNAKLLEAQALQNQKDFSAEDVDRRDALIKEGMSLKSQGNLVQQMVDSLKETLEEPRQTTEKKAFRSLGHYLIETKLRYTPSYRGALHPYFEKNKGRQFSDPSEPATTWITGRKELAESVGATGGFLVPEEFLPNLLSVVYETNPLRSRCTRIPMRRRQISIPVLDQTGDTAGTSNMYGGMVAKWTEEGATKSETEPEFRDIQLIAHKLVCYTVATDELLDDEAVGLVAFLSGERGWSGTIAHQEEYTFYQGDGAGKPLGVVGHPATVTIERATANEINPADLFQMLSQHHGGNGMWSIARSAMPQILGMNGPAGNPSYIFINNAVDGLPMRLFGMPIQWTEKLPTLGTEGDIILGDWSYYLLGDRQATTIRSSSDFKFDEDKTVWRAVHRVGGQPWLSAPIMLQDGATEISPFVTLTDPD